MAKLLAGLNVIYNIFEPLRQITEICLQIKYIRVGAQFYSALISNAANRTIRCTKLLWFVSGNRLLNILVTSQLERLNCSRYECVNAVRVLLTLAASPGPGVLSCDPD